MIKLLQSLLLLSLLGLASLTSRAQSPTAPASFVVTHYDALIEPDIARKTITGSLLITVKARTDGAKVLELDCGDLKVESVREGPEALKYSQADHRLTVFLRSAKANQLRTIQIRYQGTPRRGIRFFPERTQVYTVFSTSHWMVCVDDPDQRSTLRLRLMIPADQTTVGNGRFIARKAAADGKFIEEWRQELPVPTYTFGFVAGRFRTVSERRSGTWLHYLANEFSDEQTRRIFRDTADMITFYEERAGVKYPGVRYTQVLAAGGVEQEMSGFTALREKYGSEVLADERDIWLGAHELAHQWWGIGVGCEAWTHFWLNEGMASFMADAYKEHRFGRGEYLKEIEAARKLYEKVRDAGKDRSLVFPDWLHPTAEDRTLVYDKGAYVLHLLRVEMGERDFWAGIRLYTQKYFGKSVTTVDFQRVMQQASEKSLDAFFARWVYMTQVSTGR